MDVEPTSETLKLNLLIERASKDENLLIRQLLLQKAKFEHGGWLKVKIHK
jgi:hypothetical protein